jgi:hypothetical protein
MKSTNVKYFYLNYRYFPSTYIKKLDGENDFYLSDGGLLHNNPTYLGIYF